MTSLSVVIPTIRGRDRWLRRARRAFSGHELIVIRNRPTCGIAWNEGLAQATGDYILLAADDIEPASTGWLEAGMRWADDGFLPCARILNTDGSLQSCGDWEEEMDTGTYCDFARIPFGTREQVLTIAPIIETHYATDYWFSHRGREEGWPTVVVREFCFYHHFAQVGRLDHRLNDDMRTFWRAAGLPGEPRPG